MDSKVSPCRSCSFPGVNPSSHNVHTPPRNTMKYGWTLKLPLVKGPSFTTSVPKVIPFTLPRNTTKHSEIQQITMHRGSNRQATTSQRSHYPKTQRNSDITVKYDAGGEPIEACEPLKPRSSRQATGNSQERIFRLQGAGRK